MSTKPTVHEVSHHEPSHRSAMVARFGALYTLLGLRALLQPLRLTPASVASMRKAHANGPVVYVLLWASTLDYLAFNRALLAEDLPLSVWANGVVTAWLRPIAQLVRLLVRGLSGGFSRAGDPVQSGWLAKQVQRGRTLTVCLDDSPGLLARLWRPRHADPLQAVLAAQASFDVPIALVPVLVVWDRAPDRGVHPPLAFMAADSTPPSLIARLRGALLPPRDAFVQSGEPLNLLSFVERVTSNRPVVLRTLLRRYLLRESHVVRGPRLISHQVMRSLVLDNPPMRRLAQQESERTGTPIDQVQRSLDHELSSIAANFRWWVVRMMSWVLWPLWTQVYAGVDSPQADLERIRNAMRDGTAVLMPSHKSHFDYLLIGWVFYKHGMVLPHVVAGANLKIPLVSFFLRSAGAFFIRRSLSGKPIHAAVFRRYLFELIRHGYPVKFYPEGGRTRSGKLLPPKLGVLGMVLDAAARRPTQLDVTLLPIAITYEQVAEEREYARELSGGTKQKESLGQVARAVQVMRRRYGRVYLRVGRPVAVAPLVDASPTTPAWHDRSPVARKQQLTQTGRRVLARIAECSVLLPTSLVALALLAHHRRGIREGELMDRVQRFDQWFSRLGTPKAASLASLSTAASQALVRFARSGLVTRHDPAEGPIWIINIEQRITLDFYKNQAVHGFAAAGLVAAVIRTVPDPQFTANALREPFAQLLAVMEREFIFDPDETANALMLKGLDALTLHGALAPTENGWVTSNDQRMGEVYTLIRDLLEGYALVLGEVSHQEPQFRAAYVRSLQQRSETWIARGVITRPESLSRSTLTNAVAQLISQGAFTLDASGRLAGLEASGAAMAQLLSQMVAP